MRLTGEGFEIRPYFINKRIQEIHFTAVSGDVPVLSQLFRIFYAGCSKVWNI